MYCNRVLTYSATPSCAIIHAQAHAPVRHPCVLYPCDNNNHHHHNNRMETVRFGLVRNLFVPGSTRRGLRFWDTPWLGPVQFGSVPRPVPAGSGIKRFGSVQPVRFAFSFLPGMCCAVIG